MTFRSDLFAILSDSSIQHHRGTGWRKYVALIDDVIISLLVIMNVGIAMVITMPEYTNSPTLNGLSLIFTLIFLAEYLLKVWAAGSQPKYRSLGNRLRYAITGGRLVDALIVFPPLFIWMYAHLGALDPEVASGFRLFQLGRLIHLLRVAKLGRVFGFTEKLAKQLRKSLPLIISSYVLLIVVALISASFIYFAENKAQPDVFSSLPRSLWWAFVTLSTTGYGDMYPKTGLGQFIGVVVILVGLIFFGVCMSIGGSAVQSALKLEEEEPPATQTDIQRLEDIVVHLNQQVTQLSEQLAHFRKS